MPLAIRWTVGNVSARGWEALGLSLRCAHQLFGAEARYSICVNSVTVDDARTRSGATAPELEWLSNSDALPTSLAARFDANMGEGVGWKLAPPQLFPDAHELALDNDVILWRMPQALEAWLAQEARCLIAEDAERCLGQFDRLCPSGAFNSGIRGLPPGYDFTQAIETTLAHADQLHGQPVQLRSELDEQGLQVAAVSVWSSPFVVRNDEVTICSPFWPKRPELGTCGAHFVGLNSRHLPWNYYDRPADSWMEEHWARHLPALRTRAGL